MQVKIVLSLVSLRPSFFQTSAHPNEIPHSNNYMSNPAGWKVIYSRLAFTIPLKNLFSVILPISGHFLPTCSLLLSFFLDLFFPLFTSTHVPSTASSLVHTINIYLSVDLCALHNNVLYCLSLSPCVSYKLTNTSSTCSCQPFQALKAEQKAWCSAFQRC